MRSLWLKLLGAFVLVVLIGSAVDAFLMYRAAYGQFSRFVTQGGEASARQLAPVLAAYFQRTGSWQGVESVLNSPWITMMDANPAQAGVPSSDAQRWPGMMEPGMMDHEMDDMMHDSEMTGASSMQSTDMGNNMWASMGFRLLLVDTQNAVVADSAAGLTGSTLSAADLAMGMPVIVDGRQVGTLLVVTATVDNPSPATDFLQALNRSTWLSSLAAGGLALVLGLFLFRQIVAPVRAVTTAALRVAAGEFNQRVPITSGDEIGQLAAAFNQMAEALVRDQQLRRNMIADIAHELRTPLSVIHANLEAMQDGILSPNPQEIALLQEKSLLLSRLVADLRLLSLAEAGQLKLERAPVDLSILLTRELDPMRIQADGRGVKLEMQIADPLPRVDVDADRIRQVIGNLVGNALRYTAAGGKIIVRAFEGAEGSGTPEVVVEVNDSGQGIAPEDIPYVFDHFYRADKSRSRASGGSGIGLAIVKQLVEAHGGRVWVKSQLGEGATFSFAVPVA